MRPQGRNANSIRDEVSALQVGELKRRVHWGRKMPEVSWPCLIKKAEVNRPEHLTVETYLGQFEGSASNPARVRCSNGEIYALKGPLAGQMIYNDQVCALLGKLIGAPVPDVAVASLSQELIDLNGGNMTHLGAGLCHASKLIPESSIRVNGIDHLDQGDNRDRFLRLAIFFGWMAGGDQQFIYKNQPPRLVHSVDHGHFFPNGPTWTVQSLQGAPKAEVDQSLAQSCRFTPDELDREMVMLQSVTAEQVADAVARPPDSWGVTTDMRSALAQYLYVRRDDLLASHLREVA